MSDLWHELWSSHEPWGGYRSLHDSETFASLALRLDAAARWRDGHPRMGQHVHLVAIREGELVGQVEGWIEFSKFAPGPRICELRSLVVRETCRGSGVGALLIRELESLVKAHFPYGPVILTAEVLKKNPAREFYASLGFRPIAANYRFGDGHSNICPLLVRELLSSSRLTVEPGVWGATHAVKRHATGVVRLRQALHQERLRAGDPRFGPLRELDATAIEGWGQRAECEWGEMESHWVSTSFFTPQASCALTHTELAAPFAPGIRSAVSDLATSDGTSLVEQIVPLLVSVLREADLFGARFLEVRDIYAPSPLAHALGELGARPWSILVARSG